MTANVRDNTRDTNIEIYIFHSRQNILIIRMYMKADEKNKEKKDKKIYILPVVFLADVYFELMFSNRIESIISIQYCQ